MFKEWEKSPAGTAFELDEFIATLKYNADGLIPAIAQQHDTGEVLMMAYMNDKSIRETLREGQVCYWSRSRQTYWRKGESSGHRQKLVSMRADCDGDTLLLLVDQQGPACHTNRRNCFFFEVDGNGATVLNDVDSGL
ncbi:phosphoribosyl-AMP cyclohydrolase [Reinekea marinisedimentorum]|uniref:Phosphoribosyl-AMP cyclohydrolase n=1 Tax=Reinekea marinisedimentorum TaxID=230495 RepID=A0A4R3I799_9GAMM|nr:phosphoribosyl-AMP cyclohydrolase [Reinekea marinisedimentorum]TCS41630.1 phosphoribosyl-AMP cyclohydrolase [Reinekea marinisedimentorum]